MSDTRARIAALEADLAKVVEHTSETTRLSHQVGALEADAATAASELARAQKLRAAEQHALRRRLHNQKTELRQLGRAYRATSDAANKLSRERDDLNEALGLVRGHANSDLVGAVAALKHRLDELAAPTRDRFVAWYDSLPNEERVAVWYEATAMTREDVEAKLATLATVTRERNDARHRVDQLERAANALLNAMANEGEEGADIKGSYERLRATLASEPEAAPADPEPVEATREPDPPATALAIGSRWSVGADRTIKLTVRGVYDGCVTYQYDNGYWHALTVARFRASFRPDREASSEPHVAVIPLEGLPSVIATDPELPLIVPSVSYEPVSPVSRDLRSCDCARCWKQPVIGGYMVVCRTCGNKRCPKAEWHGFVCTNSNEPGQVGVLGVPEESAEVEPAAPAVPSRRVELFGEEDRLQLARDANDAGRQEVAIDEILTFLRTLRRLKESEPQ